MFAEDVGLIPLKFFSYFLDNILYDKDTTHFKQDMTMIFKALATGDKVGVAKMPYLNGDVFADSNSPELNLQEIQTLRNTANQDWTEINPSIFGTLFERVIDESKRAKLGAHYTPVEDILDVIEPVVLEPLQQEWETVRGQVEPFIKRYYEANGKNGLQRTAFDATVGDKDRDAAKEKLENFLERLGSVTILDPACGSGNFLYVTMKRLMDLELEVRSTIRLLEPGFSIPTRIHPKQFYGLEINEYAHAISSMVLVGLVIFSGLGLMVKKLAISLY